MKTVVLQKQEISHGPLNIYVEKYHKASSLLKIYFLGNNKTFQKEPCLACIPIVSHVL